MFDTENHSPPFINQNDFQVVTDFTRSQDYTALGWRTHQNHNSGDFTPDITLSNTGLKMTASTKPLTGNSGVFSYNHAGLYLKPVKLRTGIAAEVVIDSINVTACPHTRYANLARFATGAVFFSNGTRRDDDKWYNSVFVATGVGMVVGEDRPFDGLNAFAVILHCKDTCLVLEDYSPAGKEPANVLLLKRLGPVQQGAPATIGVEFIQSEKKVIFYHDDNRHEHLFDMDMEFTKFNPFLKFDLANFAAPCDDNNAISSIDVSVRKVYIKN